MGNVRPLPPPPQPPIYLSPPPDPLSNRPDPNNRLPKNRILLRTPPEMERHARLHHRHRAHPPPMALLRLPDRNVWDTGAVWRLLCDHCGVYWECAGCGAVYCGGAGEVGRGEEKCGLPCVGREKEDIRTCRVAGWETERNIDRGVVLYIVVALKGFGQPTVHFLGGRWEAWPGVCSCLGHISGSRNTTYDIVPRQSVWRNQPG
jgi:hypothetical protein